MLVLTVFHKNKINLLGEGKKRARHKSYFHVFTNIHINACLYINMPIVEFVWHLLLFALIEHNDILRCAKFSHCVQIFNVKTL